MSTEADDLDGALAGLYRRPLGEFVAACDQLARQVRHGRRPRGGPTGGGTAAPVDQRLGGQPARPRRPHAMAELLEVGAALQRAGKPRWPANLTPPAACGRPVRICAAIARLTKRAEPLLAKAGYAASGTTLSRLAATLQRCRLL
jgi:hypothetical protein